MLFRIGNFKYRFFLILNYFNYFIYSIIINIHWQFRPFLIYFIKRINFNVNELSKDLINQFFQLSKNYRAVIFVKFIHISFLLFLCLTEFNSHNY